MCTTTKVASQNVEKNRMLDSCSSCETDSASLSSPSKISHSSATRVFESGKEACIWALSWLAFWYCCWTLASVVAWVSYLGKRVPVLSKFLQADGWPSNEPIENLFDWLWLSGTRGLVFMVPHSFCRVRQTEMIVGRRFGRLTYCIVASGTLQWFLHQFRPLDSKVLLQMPLGEIPHAILSLGCLTVAMICFLQDQRTYDIMGLSTALGYKPKSIPAKMDIITWMGLTMYQNFGGTGFILFSGLSILPRNVTRADILIRVGAAFYLRLRSAGFRKWVSDIEVLHHTTWILRGGLVLASLSYQSTSWEAMILYLILGLIVMFLLNRAEK